MTRCAMYLVAALVAACLSILTGSQVSARPEYKARFDEATKNSKAAESIKEAKCNTCHYGKTKKNRNDFGQALNKHITEEMYKSLRDNKDELHKKVDAAVKSALKEKSKQGMSFGELIEAGELPAVNPVE